jgi:hypothetical protein
MSLLFRAVTGGCLVKEHRMVLFVAMADAYGRHERPYELNASRTRQHSGGGDGFGSIVIARSDALESQVRGSPASYAALRRRVLPTAFDRSQRNNYIFSWPLRQTVGKRKFI